MKLSLHLEFRQTGDQNLRLSETRFFVDDREVGMTVEPMFASQQSDAGILKWTKGPAGLAVLLLRHRDFLGKGNKPYVLSGAADSLAKTLYDVVRRKPGDEKARWLDHMFDRTNQALNNLFFPSGDNRTHFEVSLSSLLREMDLRVKIQGTELKSAAYAALADQIEEQFVPQVSPPDDASLDADLRVLVWNGEAQRYLRAGGTRTLPLRSGSMVRIEAALGPNPGFAYLVWIDSTGSVNALYPWEELGNWDGVESISKVQRISRPAGEEFVGFPVDTPPGLETALLLVREEPLDGNRLKQIPELIGRLPTPEVSSVLKDQPFFYDGATAPAPPPQSMHRLGTPGLPLNLATQKLPVDDPIRRYHEQIAEVLRSDFPILRAVSLVNCG